MTVCIMPVATSKLTFGVNRPQRWWDEHPDQQLIYAEIKQSIQANGLKNPLEVTHDSRGYVVDVGNQRLKALLELGVETAPCKVTFRDE